jgi:hypothetical protein
MRWLALAAVAALTLAGCSDGKSGDPAATPNNPEGLPLLHGYVFDPALRPLAGATVKVLDANASTTADDEGFFGFDGLPAEQFLVVVATMDGFTPTSKQITLAVDTPVRLNFTLEPVPIETPYSQVLKQELLVECQVGWVAADQFNQMNCGTGVQEIDQFDIAVDVSLAGAVIEVFWEPTSSLSESIGAKLETLELGQLNLVLGQVVGTSPLRITVPESTAERYYPQGGLMRLTIFAEPNSDENEAGVGASVLVSQAVTAYASLFYVAPPDPSYSIADAS